MIFINYTQGTSRIQCRIYFRIVMENNLNTKDFSADCVNLRFKTLTNKINMIVF